MRKWELKNGTSILSELVSFDPKTQKVVLRTHDHKLVEYSEGDFSAIDRAWLLEWSESAKELKDLEAELGGKVEHLQTTGKYPTNLYVYHPSKKADQPPTTEKPPVMILFHTGDQALRYMWKHMAAAEAAKLTLVSCGSFHNTRSEEDEAEMNARFAEVLPWIEQHIQHDPKRLFMGGTSGAACRSYDYSARFIRPWAGIYANGGWLGGPENYERPYPKGMRIAMVNGDKDERANSWIQPDSEVLVKAGNDVAVMAFEGGHQVPPVSVQTKAFRWLLREID